MKVFYCKVNCDFGGGMVLVAAKDVREAYLTAYNDKNLRWLFHFNYLPIAEWKEIMNMTYDAKKPKVIVSSCYIE